MLPYGEEIKDQKEVEFNEAYIEELDHYIGGKVVVPGKDSIPVPARLKRKKRDDLGNTIGEEHSNPLLETRVYELEFPNGTVDEYAVNIVIENLVD